MKETFSPQSHRDVTTVLVSNQEWSGDMIRNVTVAVTIRGNVKTVVATPGGEWTLVKFPRLEGGILGQTLDGSNDVGNRTGWLDGMAILGGFRMGKIMKGFVGGRCGHRISVYDHGTRKSRTLVFGPDGPAWEG